MNAAVKNGQVIHSLAHCYTHGSANISKIPDLLIKVLELKMWQNFVVESTGREVSFGSFKEFIEAPIPDGMGASMDDIRRLCSHRMDVLTLLDESNRNPVGRPPSPVVPMVKWEPSEDEATESEEEAPDESGPVASEDTPEVALDKLADEIDNNVINKSARTSAVGNTKEGGLRRLRDQRPDLHDKVVAGEKTVHAACVEAGFRKPPPGPVLAAQKAVQKMSPEELEEFKQWLASYHDE